MNKIKFNECEVHPNLFENFDTNLTVGDVRNELNNSDIVKQIFKGVCKDKCYVFLNQYYLNFIKVKNFKYDGTIQYSGIRVSLSNSQEESTSFWIENGNLIKEISLSYAKTMLPIEISNELFDEIYHAVKYFHDGLNDLISYNEQGDTLMDKRITLKKEFIKQCKFDDSVKVSDAIQKYKEEKLKYETSKHKLLVEEYKKLTKCMVSYNNIVIFNDEELERGSFRYDANLDSYYLYGNRIIISNDYFYVYQNVKIYATKFRSIGLVVPTYITIKLIELLNKYSFHGDEVYKFLGNINI